MDDVSNGVNEVNEILRYAQNDTLDDDGDAVNALDKILRCAQNDTLGMMTMFGRMTR